MPPWSRPTSTGSSSWPPRATTAATPEAANFAPGNDPFALTVGAVDDKATADRSDDAYTEWSSVGQTQDGVAKPEIAAPGSQIVSTLAGGSDFSRLCPTCIVEREYIRAGGTSMAAPIVSGVAALVFQRHPDWTPDQVKSTLIATARNLDGSVEEVNASAAVAADTPAPATTARIDPNELVDAGTGEIDYTRSSWSRSSWSTAPESLIAGWARSSWSCVCFGVSETARSIPRGRAGAAPRGAAPRGAGRPGRRTGASRKEVNRGGLIASPDRDRRRDQQRSSRSRSLTPRRQPAAAARKPIVQFDAGTATAERRAAVRAAGGVVVRDLHVIDALGARLPVGGSQRLSRMADVRAVTPNAAMRPDVPRTEIAGARGARRICRPPTCTRREPTRCGRIATRRPPAQASRWR